MIVAAASVVPESIALDIPGVPTSLVMSWIAWLVLGTLSVAVARRATMVPGRAQLVLESAIDYVTDLADQMIGPERAPRYYPLLLGLFLYILTCNLMGLVPGLQCPTADANTAFGLAILVALYYNAEGIRTHGWGYLRQFTGPPMPWFLLPVRFLLMLLETIALLVRPFSLGMRLFCNMFSKELLLGILASLIVQFIADPVRLQKWFSLGPLLLRPVILLLGAMVGFIQALVFTILAMAYIGGAVQSEHDVERGV